MQFRLGLVAVGRRLYGAAALLKLALQSGDDIEDDVLADVFNHLGPIEGLYELLVDLFKQQYPLAVRAGGYAYGLAITLFHVRTQLNTFIADVYVSEACN